MAIDYSVKGKGNERKTYEVINQHTYNSRGKIIRNPWDSDIEYLYEVTVKYRGQIDPSADAPFHRTVKPGDMYISIADAITGNDSDWRNFKGQPVSKGDALFFTDSEMWYKIGSQDSPDSDHIDPVRTIHEYSVSKNRSLWKLHYSKLSDQVFFEADSDQVFVFSHDLLNPQASAIIEGETTSAKDVTFYFYGQGAKSSGRLTITDSNLKVYPISSFTGATGAIQADGSLIFTLDDSEDQRLYVTLDSDVFYSMVARYDHPTLITRLDCRTNLAWRRRPLWVDQLKWVDHNWRAADSDQRIVIKDNDSEIRRMLDSEIHDRKAADSDLFAKLDSENKRMHDSDRHDRAAADSDLWIRTDSEMTRRSDSDRHDWRAADSDLKAYFDSENLRMHDSDRHDFKAGDSDIRSDFDSDIHWLKAYDSDYDSEVRRMFDSERHDWKAADSDIIKNVDSDIHWLKAYDSDYDSEVRRMFDSERHDWKAADSDIKYDLDSDIKYLQEVTVKYRGQIDPTKNPVHHITVKPGDLYTVTHTGLVVNDSDWKNLRGFPVTKGDSLLFTDSETWLNLRGEVFKDSEHVSLVNNIATMYQSADNRNQNYLRKLHYAVKSDTLFVELDSDQLFIFENDTLKRGSCYMVEGQSNTLKSTMVSFTNGGPTTSGTMFWRRADHSIRAITGGGLGTVVFNPDGSLTFSAADSDDSRMVIVLDSDMEVTDYIEYYHGASGLRSVLRPVDIEGWADPIAPGKPDIWWRKVSKQRLDLDSEIHDRKAADSDLIADLDSENKRMHDSDRHDWKADDSDLWIRTDSEMTRRSDSDRHDWRAADSDLKAYFDSENLRMHDSDRHDWKAADSDQFHGAIKTVIVSNWDEKEITPYNGTYGANVWYRNGNSTGTNGTGFNGVTEYKIGDRITMAADGTSPVNALVVSENDVFTPYGVIVTIMLDGDVIARDTYPDKKNIDIVRDNFQRRPILATNGKFYVVPNNVLYNRRDSDTGYYNVVEIGNIQYQLGEDSDFRTKEEYDDLISTTHRNLFYRDLIMQEQLDSENKRMHDSDRHDFKAADSDLLKDIDSDIHALKSYDSDYDSEVRRMFDSERHDWKAADSDIIKNIDSDIHWLKAYDSDYDSEVRRMFDSERHDWKAADSDIRADIDSDIHWLKAYDSDYDSEVRRMFDSERHDWKAADSDIRYDLDSDILYLQINTMKFRGTLDITKNRPSHTKVKAGDVWLNSGVGAVLDDSEWPGVRGQGIEPGQMVMYTDSDTFVFMGANRKADSEHVTHVNSIVDFNSGDITHTDYDHYRVFGKVHTTDVTETAFIAVDSEDIRIIHTEGPFNNGSVILDGKVDGGTNHFKFSTQNAGPKTRGRITIRDNTRDSDMEFNAIYHNVTNVVISADNTSAEFTLLDSEIQAFDGRMNSRFIIEHEIVVKYTDLQTGEVSTLYKEPGKTGFKRAAPWVAFAKNNDSDRHDFKAYDSDLRVNINLWDSDKTYNIGSVVFWKGISWTSTTLSHSGNEPSTSSDFWVYEESPLLSEAQLLTYVDRVVSSPDLTTIDAVLTADTTTVPGEIASIRYHFDSDTTGGHHRIYLVQYKNEETAPGSGEYGVNYIFQGPTDGLIYHRGEEQLYLFESGLGDKFKRWATFEVDNFVKYNSDSDISVRGIFFNNDSEGYLHWNPVDYTLDLHVNDEVTLQLGQEQTIFVRNESGRDMPNGTVVRLDGVSGSEFVVNFASNDSELGSHSTLGVTTQFIGNNNGGFVTFVGKVRGLDTQTPGWTVGDALWLGTDGNMTNVKPVSPAHLVFVGYVERVHANDGIIYVKTQNGYELEEIHDVLITDHSDDNHNRVLMYDSDSNLWKNARINVDYGEF